MVLKEVDFWSFSPMVLKEVSFLDPSSMGLKEPFFGTFWDSMVLKEFTLGPFLAHLVDGLERTLLPDFWWMVLKESRPWHFFPWSWREFWVWSRDDLDLLLCHLHGVLLSILQRKWNEMNSWSCFLSSQLLKQTLRYFYITLIWDLVWCSLGVQWW